MLLANEKTPHEYNVQKIKLLIDSLILRFKTNLFSTSHERRRTTSTRADHNGRSGDGRDWH